MNHPLLDPDLVFRIGNLTVLPAWIALLLSPSRARWAAGARFWAARVWPAGLAALYGAMLLSHWPSGGGYGSLVEVQALFAAPGALVAGWLHYLAFDLFVGGWIAQRGAERGWPHALVVPVLVLTFLFGPLGLLAYAALRAWRPGAPGRLA